MDPSVSTFEWIVVVLLIVLSFISSISETAIVSSSKAKLQTLLDQGDKRAEIALKIKENQSQVLATCLVANNIANISVSSLVAMLVQKQFSSDLVGIATGILTFVIMVFSEVTPKNIAATYPETAFLCFAKLIKFIATILGPVSMIVNFCSKMILKPFNIDIDKELETFTEEEIKTIVDISHEEGVLEAEEKNFIHNVFELDELTVKEIMVPRADVTFVNENITYSELLDLFHHELYTRLPVYADTQDNIIGVVNMKDLLVIDTNKKDFDIHKIMREPFFVYENRKVSDLLKEMRLKTQNFAIVLDEYGTTSGIVTMEDILEEIVGDIRDEYDKDEEELIKKISDNEYIIEGSVKIDDINEKLGTEINKQDDFDSIGGMVLSKLDHIPEENEEVDYDDYHLKVLKMDNNRIELVNLKLPNKESNSYEQEN